MREMVLGDVIGNATPTLLRLRDDGDDVWERKRGLLLELKRKWKDRLEKENWVFPVNDGRLGSYNTHGKKHVYDHPGEGIGRQTFREVVLA
jgi:hypothetical protein